ncbi:MAG: HAMP domain-containing sensor histidine kinase, partial [Planctomycetia bacterium]|nr:HAMP domain-containing sensor histidine kinase [Planctomycetia bacterium]
MGHSSGNLQGHVDMTSEMRSYELPLPPVGAAAPQEPPAEMQASLPEPFLVNNVLWFCRFRWMVIAAFVAFGILGMFPDALGYFGLKGRRAWPLVTAAVLAFANLGFLWHAGALTRSASRPAGARGNIWAQILLDLVILTFVVHFVGSMETFVPFAYLFHIVLACIFFSRPQSLAVTLIACVLYASCVWLEHAAVVSPGGVYADAMLRARIDGTPGLVLLNLASATAIWVVVWYLASHLSAMVRQREHELAEANRQLKEVQEEKARHMLRTTHELYAPFAAVHANTQLLLKGYCGTLPDEARDVVRRIAARCRRLATEIQEMLQLAHLRSSDQGSLRWATLDVAEVLKACIAQARPAAEERSVSVEADLQTATAVGIEEHLKILFANLLSNAVLYSHKGGRVSVTCTAEAAGGTIVAVADDGIGIEPQKLPRIFDEYYRTDEAARHNRESTGLGLAIVK